MIDFKAFHPVNRSVTLAEIKAEPALADFALVRNSRLSVMPVSDEHWRLVCRMAETGE